MSLFQPYKGANWYWRDQSNGKQVKRSLGTKDLETAKRLAQQYDRTFRPQSMEETLAQWLAVYVATHRNPKGQQLAEDRGEQFLTKHFTPGRRIDTLTADDIRRYRLWLEAKKLSPQTVHHILSDLRCLLIWAKDSKLIRENPWPRRVMPRVQERPPDRLTDAEIAALCTLDEPWGRIARFAVETGVRWGELARARVADVSGGVLTIHQTKSGYLRRLPLPPELVIELPTAGRILPFSAKSLGFLTRKLRDLSKVERFHFHQFRHTFACRLLEHGASLETVQQALGHGSIRVTQRYARLSEFHVTSEIQKTWRVRRTNDSTMQDASDR